MILKIILLIVVIVARGAYYREGRRPGRRQSGVLELADACVGLRLDVLAVPNACWRRRSRSRFFLTEWTSQHLYR